MLSLLNIDAYSMNKLHPVWQNLNTLLAIWKATVKALLLVQSYPMATYPMAGNNRTETCQLCKNGEETTSHFLLHCQDLLEARQPYLPETLNTCHNNSISIDSDNLVKIIIDFTYLPSRDDNQEKTCSNMFYRLHNARSRR